MPSTTYKQQRAREYLEQLNGMRDHLDALQSAALKAWELATNITPKPPADTATLGTNVDGATVIKRAPENYAAAAGKLTIYQNELLDKQTEIISTIQKLDNHLYCSLLINHYVVGLTWNKTAQKIGYSCEHTKALNREALAALYDVLPTKDKTAKVHTKSY